MRICQYANIEYSTNLTDVHYSVCYNIRPTVYLRSAI